MAPVSVAMITSARPRYPRLGSMVHKNGKEQAALESSEKKDPKSSSSSSKKSPKKPSSSKSTSSSKSKTSHSYKSPNSKGLHHRHSSKEKGSASSTTSSPSSAEKKRTSRVALEKSPKKKVQNEIGDVEAKSPRFKELKAASAGVKRNYRNNAGNRESAGDEMVEDDDDSVEVIEISVNKHAPRRSKSSAESSPIKRLDDAASAGQASSPSATASANQSKTHFDRVHHLAILRWFIV